MWMYIYIYIYINIYKRYKALIIFESIQKVRRICIYIYITLKYKCIYVHIFICIYMWLSNFRDIFICILYMQIHVRLTFCILSKRFPITLLGVDSSSFLVQCSWYRVGLSFLSCPPIQYFVLQNEVEMTSNFPCVIWNRCFLLHKHVGLGMVVMDSVFPFVV